MMKSRVDDLSLAAFMRGRSLGSNHESVERPRAAEAPRVSGGMGGYPLVELSCRSRAAFAWLVDRERVSGPPRKSPEKNPADASLVAPAVRSGVVGHPVRGRDAAAGCPAAHLWALGE